MVPCNRKIIDPVPDSVIVFVCVAIKHAIQEYETGRQVTAEFEGNGIVRKCESLVKVDV